VVCWLESEGCPCDRACFGQVEWTRAPTEGCHCFSMSSGGKRRGSGRGKAKRNDLVDSSGDRNGSAHRYIGALGERRTTAR
jgi:hypothetical protein